MQSFTDASAPGSMDRMDVTSTAVSSMAPPGNGHSSPETEQGNNATNENPDNHVGVQGGTGTAALAAVQGPKVIQTAFIHKLYNMLEDKSIAHLISWSNTNESFVMSPSNDFSKVLSQYFKHTNVSSFVRQLNMYGFHKVSDVYHGGSPESALWEFRHGMGSFRKGDLVGLQGIKRRPSRQTLIQRDFPGSRPIPPQPGTPVEPVTDPTEQRMAHMEHTIYRMSQHISRTEDHLSGLGARCQTVVDSLIRCHEWIESLSSHTQSLAQSDSTLSTGVSNMHKEIARSLEAVRSLCTSQETLLNGRHPYFGNMSLDSHLPLSPRHPLFDESRRSSVQTLEPPSVSFGQGYVGRSANVPTSPRSYGTASLSNPKTSPNSIFDRPAPPLYRPSAMSNSTYDDGPNLARRHTTADIRQHGWPPNLPPLPQLSQNLNVLSNSSPHPSAHSSSAWSPSSNRATTTASLGAPHEHQHLRDHFASYEMNPSSGRRHPIRPHPSRQMTPPPISISEDVPSAEHVRWSLAGGSGYVPSHDQRFARLGPDLGSAPATRRNSNASNVHSLLNPPETIDREQEDDDGAGFGGGEERKRKRR